MNGGTFAAPATADFTRNPITEPEAFVKEGRVCAKVVYTRLTEGPSTMADIAEADTDDDELYILLAVVEKGIEFVYIEAREADVTVLVNVIVPVVNAPPERPDVIAVRVVSDAGDQEPVRAEL